MHILITGGAGFIGSHTADRLLGMGHDVRILDNLQKPVHMKNIKLNITEKKCFNRPPAGKKVTKWDNTIIDWKSSLRRPW